MIAVDFEIFAIKTVNFYEDHIFNIFSKINNKKSSFIATCCFRYIIKSMSCKEWARKSNYVIARKIIHVFSIFTSIIRIVNVTTCVVVEIFWKGRYFSRLHLRKMSRFILIQCTMKCKNFKTVFRFGRTNVDLIIEMFLYSLFSCS